MFFILFLLVVALVFFVLYTFFFSFGIRWGCPPGKFPVKFDAQQTCYFLRGKIKAHVKGSNEFVEIGAGDLVIFPKGLSCTWEVSVAVDKHYKFDPS